MYTYIHGGFPKWRIPSRHQMFQYLDDKIGSPYFWTPPNGHDSFGIMYQDSSDSSLSL